MKKISVSALVLAVIMLLGIVAGCGSSPDGVGATVTESGTNGTEGESAGASGDDAAAAVGTRENPLPLGTTAKIGDWDVTVTGVNANAADAIAAANEFNEPAAAGSQYVLVNLTATYTGAESGTFWIDMMYKFYGSGGNTFESDYVVSPSPILEAGETFPGASVSGDLVFQVPADQIEGGAIIMENSFSLDDSRVFFAIK